jgi:aminodeoxyfutalosine deaminase
LFDLREYVQRMPKAELHVHLEGSIRPTTLLGLAERNQVSLPAKDEIGLLNFYRFSDFPHFIETYSTITHCLQTVDDYELIAYEFGADCTRQNIRYVEATFSIETNMRMTGLPGSEILVGLNNGRLKAQRDFGVEIRWVIDIVRDSPETQTEVLEIALAARQSGCVALGLGGNEAGFPPELFIETFQKARDAGIPRVPHAGEALGPASVWTAIDDLHAVRVGHGVRSIEDPQLVRELARRQIPLEICPTSNIRLGIFRDFQNHPLRKLWDAGVGVTIGSDDPPMFNTDLNQEYRLLVDHFSFTQDEVERVSLNSLHFSLLPDEEKLRLESEFKTEFLLLREAMA